MEPAWIAENMPIINYKEDGKKTFKLKLKILIHISHPSKNVIDIVFCAISILRLFNK
jgi:hypothetical protein